MRRYLVISLVLVGLAGCTDEPSTPRVVAPPVEDPTPEDQRTPRRRPDRRVAPFDADAIKLELRPYLAGLDSPLLITHAGDGSGRLYVVEQGGQIQVVEDGEVRREPFLDISSLVEAGGEQGLLGLAFHPDFASNGRFYVNYTDLNGDTVIAGYRSRNGSAADSGSAQVLLMIEQPYPNHNGGHLAFGRDGYLYIATGDGGGAGDPEENGQSVDTLLGKLLRIDVDGGDPYGIPPDNPFADGAEGRPEIWAYGLRNPWRFSFDGPTRTTWVGDVGQGELEEIDRVPADRAGLDYGWDVMEGSRCFESDDCSTRGKVLPITEYSHDEGCSVTGGFVYRGDAFPAMNGGYFFADFCSGVIWAIDAEVESPVRPTVVASTDRALSSFGLDEDGELYVADLGNGEVLRLVDAAAR